MEVVRNANQVTHKITPFTKSISLKYLKVNRKFKEMHPFPGRILRKEVLSGRRPASPEMTAAGSAAPGAAPAGSSAPAR